MSTHWNDDDYHYETADASFRDRDIERDQAKDIAEMMEWAENEGLRKLITTREGANFIQYGDLWVIALYGGQPIHHDRHMSEIENASHDTWNIVCSGEGNQMLVTEVAQDMFNHMAIETGGVIYLNTKNRHMVTRGDGTEICVLLQMQGRGPEEREAALEDMLNEWRKHVRRRAA